MADKPLKNRTLHKYVRDGCIQCQQITKLLVQHTPRYQKSNFENFLGQLGIYHDAQSGKLYSSKQICRNPFQVLKNQGIYLDPWNPLNSEKGNSPVWDILIIKPNQTSSNLQSVATDSESNPKSVLTDSKATLISPLKPTAPLHSQRKQHESSFFSSVLEQITTFTTNLFKRETVCLQCGKHGKYMIPFSSKASMLKKFLQLVHGSSTERNLRENVCKIPIHSRRKINKVKGKSKVETNTFKQTLQNVSSSAKQSFDDQPSAPVFTDISNNSNNKTIKLANLVFNSNNSQSIEKWWIFFVLACKGSSKHSTKVPVVLKDITKNNTMKGLKILPLTSKSNNTSKSRNLWLLMPLYARLNSPNKRLDLRIVNNLTSQTKISTKEIPILSEIVETPEVIETQTPPEAERTETDTPAIIEDSSLYNDNNNQFNVSSINTSGEVQAPLSVDTANLWRARLLVHNWNHHRYYGGIYDIFFKFYFENNLYTVLFSINIFPRNCC